MYQTVVSDKRKGKSVFSASQSTVSSSHYWLTSGGPYSTNSAKKESNCHNNGYIGNPYKKGTLPYPGLKKVNRAWSQYSSGNRFFPDWKRWTAASRALFHLPLTLFWFSASGDIPSDARARFAAARNRAYLVQIYVTVETISAIETIRLRILMDMFVWSKLIINWSWSNMV